MDYRSAVALLMPVDPRQENPGAWHLTPRALDYSSLVRTSLDPRAYLPVCPEDTHWRPFSRPYSR